MYRFPIIFSEDSIFEWTAPTNIIPNYYSWIFEVRRTNKGKHVGSFVFCKRGNNDNWTQLRHDLTKRRHATKVHPGNTQFPFYMNYNPLHGSNASRGSLGNAVIGNKALLIIETSFALIRATVARIGVQALILHAFIRIDG